MEKANFITVTVSISPEVRPIDNKWHVKFERDLIQFVTCPTFQFSATSMNVAVTKVGDLVSRHPENYFKKITIE